MIVKLPVPAINSTTGAVSQGFFDVEMPCKSALFDLNAFIEEAITVDSNRPTPLLFPKHYSKIVPTSNALGRITFVEPSVPVRIAWSIQVKVLPLPYVTLCSKKIPFIGRIYYPCVKKAWIKVTVWKSRVVNVSTKFRPPAERVKPPLEWSSYADVTAHALGLILYPPPKLTLFDLLVVSYFGDAPQIFRGAYKELETLLGHRFKYLVGDPTQLIPLEVQ